MALADTWLVDDAAKKRAEARADLPGEKGTLELERRVTVVRGTPSERVALVKAATLRCWQLTGQPLPSYRRSDAPGRVLRSKR